MIMKITGLFILISLISLGCSTPTQIKVTTIPSGADAEIVDQTGMASPLGKTPLNLKESDVYKNANIASQLRIKKEGYIDQNVVLVKPLFGSEINVYVKLNKEELNQNVNEQIAAQEKIASTIAKVNGLIQAKQYPEAEIAMNNFVDQYPSISVGYDYLGNINYLQKRYAKALKFYNKANAINPVNAERKLLVDKIQNLVKIQPGDAQ